MTAQIPSSVQGTLISPVSPDVTPSPRYIGWYPMTQWTGAVAALAAPSLSVSVANVDTANDWVSGVSGAAWLVAGAPFKVRNTGTIPPGLSGSTVYYAGKPTADRVTFHATAEEALAGTGKVDITGAGTSNLVFYPAAIKDRSGQGHDMLIGASNNDLTLWGTAPYMGAASSGSADTCLGRILAATLNARFVWPTHSLFMSMRARFGTLVAGRSFWGNGSSSADGPRLSVDSTTTSKIRLTMYYGGAGGSNLGATSAADGVSESVENTIALLLDGPTRRASMWINGVRDLTISDYDLSAIASLTMPQDLRIGGAANNNAHALLASDYHVLAFEGSAPADIGDIAAYLATTRYARLRSVDA